MVVGYSRIADLHIQTTEGAFNATSRHRKYIGAPTTSMDPIALRYGLEDSIVYEFAACFDDKAWTTGSPPPSVDISLTVVGVIFPCDSCYPLHGTVYCVVAIRRGSQSAVE